MKKKKARAAEKKKKASKKPKNRVGKVCNSKAGAICFGYNLKYLRNIKPLAKCKKLCAANKKCVLAEYQARQKHCALSAIGTKAKCPGKWAKASGWVGYNICPKHVHKKKRALDLVLVLVLVVTRSTKRSRAAVLRMRAKQINAEPDPSAMPIATRKHAQLGAAKGAPGKGEHARARDAQRQRNTGRRVGRRGACRVPFHQRRLQARAND